MAKAGSAKTPSQDFELGGVCGGEGGVMG
jgi:hypothetical protein